LCSSNTLVFHKPHAKIQLPAKLVKGLSKDCSLWGADTMKFGRQVAVFQWSRLPIALEGTRSIITLETFVLLY